MMKPRAKNRTERNDQFVAGAAALKEISERAKPNSRHELPNPPEKTPSGDQSGEHPRGVPQRLHTSRSAPSCGVRSLDKQLRLPRGLILHMDSSAPVIASVGAHVLPRCGAPGLASAASAWHDSADAQLRPNYSKRRKHTLPRCAEWSMLAPTHLYENNRHRTNFPTILPLQNSLSTLSSGVAEFTPDVSCQNSTQRGSGANSPYMTLEHTF